MSEGILKTSDEWQKDIEAWCVILDPDGWDRKNYQQSWHEEAISKQEFLKRLGPSTCHFKDFKALLAWSEQP